jgi:hypothetical protein
MKRLFLRLLLPLLFSSPAFAADPSPKASDRSPDAAFDHFVEVTDMAAMLDKTNDMQVSAMVARTPSLRAIEPDLKRFFGENLSWKAISPEIRKIYLAEFTPAELDDIASFYATPTGKKAMQKMPAMMVKSKQIAMGIIQSKLPAFLESVKSKVPKPAGK